MKIGKELTIYRVGEICRVLREELRDYETMVVDATEVEEIDTAGTQLLLALKKACCTRRKGLDLRLSERVKGFLSSIGVEL